MNVWLLWELNQRQKLRLYTLLNRNPSNKTLNLLMASLLWILGKQRKMLHVSRRKSKIDNKLNEHGKRNKGSKKRNVDRRNNNVKKLPEYYNNKKVRRLDFEQNRRLKNVNARKWKNESVKKRKNFCERRLLRKSGLRQCNEILKLGK